MDKSIKNETFYLNGLNCPNCAAKIEDSLKNNQHFTSVNFSFATKKLVVESPSSGSDAFTIIADTVNSIEDGVSIEKDAFTKESSDKGLTELFKNHSYTIAGTLILVVLVIFNPQFQNPLIGYLAAYLLIGGDILLRAVKNIGKGKIFDENFLMSLATIGAFLLGEYVEAVAVMLFYKVGEGFQDYAVDKSRTSIQALLDIKAEFANKIQGSSINVVTPESLHINDIILIKPGEKVPVDCIVIEGNTTLNTAALTGESLPLSVKKDDNILSGSINNDSSIKAIVTKPYDESTVYKILDMVENASSKKAKTEQFITKFAKIYTPIVVFAALFLAFLPPILGFGSFSDWISRALIFLVISCPCALVISVPLGYFGGLGSASNQGILIKGANYLEALNTIDSFVFDKTGTLTEGKFSLASVTDDLTLKLASILEIHSNHPIATSIVQSASDEISHDMAENVLEIPGKGLSGDYKGLNLLVGNDLLMNENDISFPQQTLIGSIIHVAYNHNYIGYIHITDQIKANSKDLIHTLNRDGKETVMLTGDQSYIAETVAAELKLSNVYSQLLPEDKLTHVESLITKGRKVLFTGDGINDAPVLARADIGVAMGGIGSDAAIETADIVIMNDDPSKLLTAMTIAKKTRTIVIQNIVFALGIKLFFLSLGALGEATMYQAIFADVGVALIAVLNSMRTLKLK